MNEPVYLEDVYGYLTGLGFGTPDVDRLRRVFAKGTVTDADRRQLAHVGVPADRVPWVEQGLGDGRWRSHAYGRRQDWLALQAAVGRCLGAAGEAMASLKAAYPLGSTVRYYWRERDEVCEHPVVDYSFDDETGQPVLHAGAEREPTGNWVYYRVTLALIERAGRGSS